MRLVASEFWILLLESRHPIRSKSSIIIVSPLPEKCKQSRARDLVLGCYIEFDGVRSTQYVLPKHNQTLLPGKSRLTALNTPFRGCAAQTLVVGE